MPELTFDLTALRMWINWYRAYRPVVGSEPSIPPPMPHELGMMMHGYNPGTWEVETRPEPQKSSSATSWVPGSLSQGTVSN